MTGMIMPWLRQYGQQVDKTQKIECKHLTLRTHIKRLVRKTICFSKTT
jgi:IS1 family transposase